MEPIEVHILGSRQEEGEPVEIEMFDVVPTDPEQWILSPAQIREKLKTSWREIVLPSGESISLLIGISTRDDNFQLYAKQNGVVVVQLSCKGYPDLDFHTVSGYFVHVAVYNKKTRTKLSGGPSKDA